MRVVINVQYKNGTNNKTKINFEKRSCKETFL